MHSISKYRTNVRPLLCPELEDEVGKQMVDSGGCVSHTTTPYFLRSDEYRSLQTYVLEL